MVVKAKKAEAKKPTGREVAKIEKPRGGTGVVGAEAAKRMREDAKKASHGFTTKDMAVPFIRIVEKTSALMKKSSPDYNEKAEQGDIYNSATEKLTGGETGIYTIPCYYGRRFTRWGLIEKDGGFKADLGSEYDLEKNCKQDDKGRWICNDNKNEHVVESGDYFVLVVDPKTGAVEQAMISMSTSRWASAKKWNTMIASLQVDDGDGGTFNPAMFAECYHLTTIIKSNDQGEWYIWAPEPYSLTMEMKNGEALYAMAKSFAEAVGEGKVKPSYVAPEEEAEEEVPPSKRNRR